MRRPLQIKLVLLLDGTVEKVETAIGTPHAGVLGFGRGPAFQSRLTFRLKVFDMTFRPLHDRVLIRRIEAAEKSAGGIIIPDTAKEKPQEGEVVSAGTGVRADDGKVTPLDVKAGDKILFGKWSGTEVKIDGEDLIIMKESDILGIVG